MPESANGRMSESWNTQYGNPKSKVGTPALPPHSNAKYRRGVLGLPRWWSDQPRAFESWSGVWFTSGGHSEGPQAWAGTLWMILPMLAHHADWLDFHPDHWASFRHVPWLGEFVTGHLGQQAESTPSVWIALRDAASGGEKEAFDGWKSDAYGDWSFFLYRPDIPSAGGQSVPLLRSTLPQPAREESIWTNPFPTVEDRPVDNRVGYSTGDGNCCLYFDIDDGYRHAGLAPQTAGFTWQVRVVYLDQGTDTWALEYYDRQGHRQRHVVRKEDSGTWRETVFELPDFYAANAFVFLELRGQ